MRRRRRIFFSVGVLACVAIAAACREPTQITLRITSAERCSDLTGVQIVVGSSADLTQTRFAQHFAAAVTHACAPDRTTNLIGTLVVTPGTSTGTVVVSAGVNAPGAPGPDPADCADPTNAKHCIIARRSFSFIEHTSLTLPIDLDPLCVGKVCDPASTCFKGTCVDDGVGCQGSTCVLPQESGSGAGSDASSSDGGYDADMGDVMSLGDGGSTEDAGASKDGSATTDAKGGVPTCLFVQQGMSMVTKCDATLGDVTPNIDCGKASDPNFECCYCTCAQGFMSGKVVSCLIDLAPGSSCHPNLCMP